MLNRRSLLLVIPSMVLTYGMTASLGRTTPPSYAHAWVGEDVRRISHEEEMQLGTGQAEGDVVSDALHAGEKPLLFDQCAAVDYGYIMEEYRLPNGRLIWDRYNAIFGVDAIVSQMRHLAVWRSQRRPYLPICARREA